MHYKKSYCKDCEGNIKAEAKGANHILHFLLCIPTAGLWIVIWLLAAVSKNWTCSECGSRRLSGAKNKSQLAQLAPGA